MKRKHRYKVLFSPWLLAIAGTILVYGGAMFVFDLAPVEEAKSLDVQKPFVLFAAISSSQGGGVQAEQAALLDSSPLFLPSRWNNGSAFVANVRERKPEEVFDLFPPRFFFHEADLAAGLAVDLGSPKELQEYVFDWNKDSPDAMGRRDSGYPASADRFALLEAVTSASSAPAISFVFPRKPVLERVSSLWAPAEFSVIVDSVGVVGLPLLLQGSGEGQVDQILEQLLDEFLLEKAGALDPGYYRIFIGP